MMLQTVKNWGLRLAVLCLATSLPAIGWAAEAATTGTASAAGSQLGLVAIAIALGLGLSVIGAALGQAKAAAAALEGIARNPNAADKVFVPLLLSLSFIESLVLFVWVLMFLLLGKLA